jgi:hypothetical protein
MDKQVRAAISQARDQLESDEESLERLNELAHLWNESCYHLVMSYTGLSLMCLVNAENVHSILEMAHCIVRRNRSSGSSVFVH